MLGSELQRLASVAGLVDSDISPRPTTIRAVEGGLVAIYAGTYIYGAVHTPGEVSGADEVVVGSSQFHALAALFETGEEVSLSLRGHNLALRARGRSANLRVLPEEASAIRQPEPAGYVVVDNTTLVAEVTTAARFVNDTEVTVPILGSLRLRTDGKKLLLMAFDGKAGLYAATLSVEGEDHQPAVFDLSVPPNDIRAGVKLLSGPIVLCPMASAAPGRAGRLVLAGEGAAVHVATFAGEWPNIGAFMNQRERSSVVLPAAGLASVLAGAKALQAEATIILSRTNENFRVQTEESELGAFAVGLEAQPDLALGDFPKRLVLPLAAVKLAATLGDTVTLGVSPERGVPLLFQAGHRRYWVQQSV